MQTLRHHGQWLWLSWYSGCFQHQRSTAVRIKSSANFYKEHLLIVSCKKKTKIKKKRLGRVQKHLGIIGQRDWGLAWLISTPITLIRIPVRCTVNILWKCLKSTKKGSQFFILQNAATYCEDRFSPLAAEVFLPWPHPLRGCQRPLELNFPSKNKTIKEQPPKCRI